MNESMIRPKSQFTSGDSLNWDMHQDVLSKKYNFVKDFTLALSYETELNMNTIFKLKALSSKVISSKMMKMIRECLE